MQNVSPAKAVEACKGRPHGAIQEHAVQSFLPLGPGAAPGRSLSPNGLSFLPNQPSTIVPAPLTSPSMLQTSQANGLVYSTLVGFGFVGVYAGYRVKSKVDFLSGIKTQSGASQLISCSRSHRAC